MIAEIPTTLDGVRSALSAFQKASDAYDVGPSISECELYTSKFCTDKSTKETLQMLDIKSKTAMDAIKKFITMIFTAGSCNSTFLMPLRGFITDSLYALVTDYYPYGNLHDLLFKSSDVLISPTHKTVIAMCVAYGMMRMHEKGFFHRDLCAQNIYLNDEKLPVICDFQMANSKNVFTDSPRYHSPELIFNKDIDQKTDVYSFGLLLYELSEEHVAFENYNNLQITSLLQTEQRPQFTSKTPQKLMNLIEQCWAQNPSYRPPFKAIYEKFTDGSVSFPEADIKTVKQMAFNIGQKSSHSLHYVERAPDEIQVQQIRATKKTLRKSIKFNYSILENPDHPNLLSYIITLFEKLQKNDYIAFYEVLSAHFETSSAIVIHTILQHFVIQSLKDNDFLVTIINRGFFLDPPVISPTAISLTMDLLAIYFTKDIHLFTPKLRPQIELFIAMRPKDSLALLHNYINAGGYHYEFFAIYLQHYQSFFMADLIGLFAAAMLSALNSPQFLENSLKDYYSVFLEAVQQPDPKVVKVGYHALLAHFDPTIPINYNTLLTHLKEPELAETALQIASRVQLPPSKSYFEALMKIAIQFKSRQAIYTMCMFMNHSAAHVNRTKELIWVPLIQPDDAFIILLTAAKFIECEQIFPQIPGIAEFVYAFYKMIRPDQTIAFLKLLSCIVFAPQTFQTREMQEMYHNLFTLSIYCDNDDLKCTGVMLIWTAARMGPHPDFVLVIPFLIDMIKNQVKYTYSVIGALSQLAKFPDSYEQMKNNQLVPYFQSLLQYPQYADFAKQFLLYVH